jgi:hypothetical protein
MRRSVHLFIFGAQGRGAAAMYRFLMATSAAFRLPMLALAWLLVAGKRRRNIGQSIRKWATILHWSACETMGAPPSSGFKSSTSAVL